MCIIILRPANTELSEDKLFNSFQSNPDGAGFCYISTDYAQVSRLKIVKAMDYATFLKKYKRAVKNNPESPFLIHFRIATHGTVDKFNCHPFKINKKMAFVHNGIISSMPKDAKMSDTQMFNELILKKLPSGWDTNPSIKLLLEKFLVGSKIVTLNVNGHVEIYNESSGHWKDGCWFSNTSYQRMVYNKGVAVYKAPVTVFASNFYCDDCGYRISGYDAHFYQKKGKSAVCLCKDCKVKALDEARVSLTDGISRHKYVEEIQKEDFYSYTGNYGCYE